MAESWIHQVDKKTWNKLSFYVNIILFIVVALATFVLILDSYSAGKIATSGAGDQLSQAWIYIVRDIAFIAIALAIIFYQFFRNLRILMLRSW
jgi:hypothetical protein